MQVLSVASLILAFSLLAAAGLHTDYPDLSYPVQIVGMSNPDGTCWTGMDLDGGYLKDGLPLPVDPNSYLIGQPPTEKTGVTIPTDHWIEFDLGGPIGDGPGPDIVITEQGRMGEYAMVLLGDMVHAPYPIGIIQADDSGGPASSIIELELSGLDLPFTPRTVRILSTGLGGGAPGFDIGCLMARVLHQGGPYAYHPNPPDDAQDVDPRPVLTWRAGDRTAGHLLYFSKDRSKVGSALHPVSLPAEVTSFEPGMLELGQVYYWRVDQVDQNQPDQIYKGPIWSFRVREELRIDRFEVPLIANWRMAQDSWSAQPSFGNEWPPPAFEGCQSLCIQFKVYYNIHSGLTYSLPAPADWASTNARFLQMAIKGSPVNPRMARLYLRVSDGQGTSTIYYTKDPYVLLDPNWRIWRVPLANLTGIDLRHVTSITIGAYGQIGEASWPVEGWLYVDDIRLTCKGCDQINCRPYDLDCNCTVDWHDLQIMTEYWLAGGTRRVPIQEPNTPIAWYRFEGNTNDSIGSVDGELLGQCYFVQGKVGLGLAMGMVATGWSTTEDRVRIPEAGRLFSNLEKGLTIALWQKGNDSIHYIDTLVCSDYRYGISDPAILATIGCWDRPGFYQWAYGRPMDLADIVYRPHRSAKEWMGRWNHWAFTKDLRTGRMCVFLNGLLIASTAGKPQPPANIQYLDIGNGWFGYYDGQIDEVKIFDYPICQQEAAYLASEGTGLIETAQQPRFDLNNDGLVRWQDFAIMARQWLTAIEDL